MKLSRIQQQRRRYRRYCEVTEGARISFECFQECEADSGEWDEDTNQCPPQKSHRPVASKVIARTDKQNGEI